ncbi:hypothetical protein MUK42_04275 [Musa troglodytarum]|uniref:Uncharacterized protein n=1 Tax=Musa troglodytarum TaxID=320322 RepID=A0A9E7H0L0_9LILI|nr:hypothetical protein MUK42_04275 [Musa troglodytarum]
MKERSRGLREQIKNMLHDHSDLLQTMQLIDAIQLLGVDYHFEKEISEALSKVYDADFNTHGLYEAALRFRLLRQHGYNISPDVNTLLRTADVFNKFKDEEGSFVSDLRGDVEGLLSLYNAAYLGTHGETILDEAISFTSSILTSMLCDLEPPLVSKVSLSLETPLFRRTKRLSTRNYIPIYQEDATRNDVLLELAKLDFNLVQSLHREELKSLSIWWKDLALVKSLSFVRDRLVECYYWILPVFSEPHYSRARVMTVKLTALASIMDDIYDNYSTLEESRLLTDAIQSSIFTWEAQAVDQLPDYMKDYYLKLINNFEEMKDELALEEKYRMLYLKEEIKTLARFYFEESKWGVERYVPTVEEHLHISMMTTTYSMLACASFAGMGEVATKEAFEWVTKCYMKQYGTDANEACKKLQMLVQDAWKDLNKECLNPTAVPMPLLERLVNLSRSMEDTHKYIDSYTHSNTTTKDRVTLLLVTGNKKDSSNIFCLCGGEQYTIAIWIAMTQLPLQKVSSGRLTLSRRSSQLRFCGKLLLNFFLLNMSCSSGGALLSSDATALSVVGLIVPGGSTAGERCYRRYTQALGDTTAWCLVGGQYHRLA